MRLMRVKKGRGLTWPNGFTSHEQSWRGGAGYVVDLDAPCETDLFCKGAMHVLEPAPTDVTAATKIELPRALKTISEARKRNAAGSADAALAAPTTSAASDTTMPPVLRPGSRKAVAEKTG